MSFIETNSRLFEKSGNDGESPDFVPRHSMYTRISLLGPPNLAPLLSIGFYKRERLSPKNESYSPPTECCDVKDAQTALLCILSRCKRQLAIFVPRQLAQSEEVRNNINAHACWFKEFSSILSDIEHTLPKTKLIKQLYEVLNSLEYSRVIKTETKLITGATISRNQHRYISMENLIRTIETHVEEVAVDMEASTQFINQDLRNTASFFCLKSVLHASCKQCEKFLKVPYVSELNENAHTSQTFNKRSNCFVDPQSSFFSATSGLETKVQILPAQSHKSHLITVNKQFYYHETFEFWGSDVVEFVQVLNYGSSGNKLLQEAKEFEAMLIGKFDVDDVSTDDNDDSANRLYVNNIKYHNLEKSVNELSIDMSLQSQLKSISNDKESLNKQINKTVSPLNELMFTEGIDPSCALIVHNDSSESITTPVAISIGTSIQNQAMHKDDEDIKKCSSEKVYVPLYSKDSSDSQTPNTDQITGHLVTTVINQAIEEALTKKSNLDSRVTLGRVYLHTFSFGNNEFKNKTPVSSPPDDNVDAPLPLNFVDSSQSSKMSKDMPHPYFNLESSGASLRNSDAENQGMKSTVRLCGEIDLSTPLCEMLSSLDNMATNSQMEVEILLQINVPTFLKSTQDFKTESK